MGSIVHIKYNFYYFFTENCPAIIYKINCLKNIDYIYKKYNILKCNDLKILCMLNYICKAFHNNLHNIVQVKYINKIYRVQFYK